mmetsp:Transcript_31730/g.49667  ORF Transcript_31730/g.49667 Transcript_31730/m.49667 type:complete len:218 (+) Transcript_31730:686-1339(+)
MVSPAQSRCCSSHHSKCALKHCSAQLLDTTREGKEQQPPTLDATVLTIEVMWLYQFSRSSARCWSTASQSPKALSSMSSSGATNMLSIEWLTVQQPSMLDGPAPCAGSEGCLLELVSHQKTMTTCPVRLTTIALSSLIGTSRILRSSGPQSCMKLSVTPSSISCSGATRLLDRSSAQVLRSDVSSSLSSSTTNWSSIARAIHAGTVALPIPVFHSTI